MSLSRRPHPYGSRKRAVTPGLFVANPDNSDEELEESPNRSPVKISPGTASSSSSRISLPRVSSGSGNGGPFGSVEGSWIDAGQGQSSNSVPIAPASAPTQHANHSMPTIPAPQSSPRPMNYPSSPGRNHSSSSPALSSPHPPLPPPQPERHIQRAQTTPAPTPGPARTHEQRPSLGSIPARDLPPPSPTRALPKLPSPSPRNSPTQIPATSVLTSHPPISSPEDVISPQSDSSRSYISLTSMDMDGRTRSGIPSKVRVQVTVDNESFTTVDITGMQTAEGIKERVFSKLRFRDEEHDNLSLFLTDVDEQPDSTPISSDGLLHLCQTKGDAKATLKFFVMQSPYTESATATVIPPVSSSSSNTPSRAEFGTPEQRDRDERSSTSERKSGGTSEWTDINSDDLIDYPAGPSNGQMTRSQGMKRLASRPSVEPSSSTPSPIREHPNKPSPLRGNITPNASRLPSGSSGQGSSSGGLQIYEEMDPATKALIAQIQEEEEAKRRQMEDDEAFAKAQQQAEREAYERRQERQIEEAQAKAAQIEEDERRARQLEAEERQQEEERLAAEQRAEEEAARTAMALDSEDREREEREERLKFASERRQRAQHFQPGQRPLDSFDSHTLPSLGQSSRSSYEDAAKYHQYPTTNPMFNSSTGYNSRNYMDSRYDAPATGERNNDLRFRQMSGRDHPPQRVFPGVGSGGAVRRDTRSPRPYAALGADPEHSSMNTRSMDNMRTFEPPPVSRPPHQGVPPRSAITPTPGNERPYSPPELYLPSPNQDGRYPDASSPRNLQVPGSPSSGYMPFPSPSISTGRSTPPPFGTTRSNFEHTRPNTVHHEYPSAPNMATRSRTDRPGTASSTASADEDSRRDAAWARWRADHEDGTRRRSGSASDAYRELATASPRRLSDSNETAPWMYPSHDGRPLTEMFDNMSVAGTVSSQATTIRPNNVRDDPDDEDSGNTAKADQWSELFRQSRAKAQGDDEEEDDEATLFLPPMSDKAGSRPNLSVLTDTGPHSQTSSSATPASSFELELKRAPTFKPPKDPEQWHVRPEPEALYDNLDNFFPEIDLDEPIVHAGLSTPTTPLSESPRHMGTPPSKQGTLPVPSPREDTIKPLPPPIHPARAEIARHGASTGFNKSENRKSIREIAGFKRRSMFKGFHTGEKEHDKGKEKKDEEKPKRRLSMWGHPIKEVNPNKAMQQIPESPASEDAPATLNWVRGDLIGRGSYGRVYLALNVTKGELMAVKQVELIQDGEGGAADKKQMGVIEALKGEIALLKDLFHPNIVAYLGCETSPKNLSIFLEYVPGGTIASIYRTPDQGQFEEQLVKFFTRQILEGLAYLHERGILHRDLKGDNILVDADGCCKISDFGISKQSNDAYDSFAGNATLMRGSSYWMAPEVLMTPNNTQIAGKKPTNRSYSAKVDIWSLGCVVLEMWSGARPYGDLDPFAAMYQLFSQGVKPALPDSVKISETAMDFMNNKCLSIAPEDRPTAKELLKHPFITTTDPKWSFAKSKIGKAVAKKGRHIKTAQSVERTMKPNVDIVSQLG